MKRDMVPDSVIVKDVSLGSQADNFNYHENRKQKKKECHSVTTNGARCIS